MRLLLGLIGLVALGSVAARAGEQFKLGPEHKLLASLAGTWDAKAKAWFDPTKKEPDESTGVMKREVILGGNFLKEEYEGKMLDQTFKGIGLLGFDPQKKKFTLVWVDNFAPTTMFSTGTYDKSKKAITYIGEEEHSGKKMKSRDVLTILGDNEALFEMYRQPAEDGGKEFKVLEIRYTRRK
jgi:hypothetical protein